MCPCGHLLGLQYAPKSITKNHLKWTRHAMYLMGADQFVYNRYTQLRGLLTRKCQSLAKQRPGDRNWQIVNEDVGRLVKELLDIVDRYLPEHPEYGEIRARVAACHRAWPPPQATAAAAPRPEQPADRTDAPHSHVVEPPG
jgi:hypothetical protein